MEWIGVRAVAGVTVNGAGADADADTGLRDTRALDRSFTVSSSATCATASS